MNVREGSPCPPRFVGKIDAEKGAADLFARSWAVRRAAAGSFNVVRPVDYVPTLDMYLQEWLDGARLTDVAGTPDFLEWVRQTARAAAALHGLDVPVRSRRTAEKEARTVHRRGQALAAIRPAQARRVRDLRDRIAAELERRVTITGIVHADLHPANIIVNTDGITLIDLDNLALGDRGLDVGRFLSALRTSALRTYGNVSALKHAGQAFLETYLQLTNEDESRLRLFEAASLMITATTGFRLQRAGWEEAADALLCECERALQQALVNRTRTPRPPDAPRRADGKRWALEPEYMRSVLSSHVRREYWAELTNCRVREGRASPRAQRIRYDLTGQRHGQPWRTSLDGILWLRGSGRGPTRRVQAVASALGGDKALFIPRTVASLTSIGLQLVERPTGVALLSLFSEETGAHLAARLAQGLVALHNTAVDLDKCRTLDQELESLRRSVERAAGVSERGGSAVAALFDTIEKRLSAVTESRRPVLRRLPLNQLLWTGERIVIASVDDVVLSHPLLDVADVLARMWWMQSATGCGETFVNAACCLRETYLGNAGGRCSDLALFEAAALLRLACGRAKQSRGRGADELLQSAAELLLQDEISEVDAHG
jgi:aminoglycoside phosphotransferase (APT) family kinase protein